MHGIQAQITPTQHSVGVQTRVSASCPVPYHIGQCTIKLIQKGEELTSWIPRTLVEPHEAQSNDTSSEYAKAVLISLLQLHLQGEEAHTMFQVQI